MKKKGASSKDQALVACERQHLLTSNRPVARWLPGAGALSVWLNFTPLPFASSLRWPVRSHTSAVAQTVVSAIHDRCLTENASCLGIRTPQPGKIIASSEGFAP
jgi:hypothetical protein